MPDTQLPITALSLPGGTCYTTPAADLPLFAAYLRAIFSGNEINTGSTTPTAENRTKPWVRTNSDGSDDGVWQFFNGFWVQKHPLPAGAVMMYEGTQASIPTFDGGESAPVTNIGGPFWEEVTQMAARSPMHPGTLAGGTVIGIGTDFGEDKHVQTLGELIQHSHIIKSFTSGATGGDGAHILNEPDPGTDVDHSTEPTGSSPPDGMNVVHPVRGIWFIRRTSRIYRRRNA
jgi:hypothetical protein